MGATNSLDDERKRFDSYSYELLLKEEARLREPGKSRRSSPLLHERRRRETTAHQQERSKVSCRITARVWRPTPPALPPCGRRRNRPRHAARSSRQKS